MTSTSKHPEITTKPFREAHLDIFRIEESHKKDCWESVRQWTQLGEILQAGTHMIDGRIIYISANILIAPGVVEVFMHPSIYLPRYRLAVLRHIKWWLKYIAQETHTRRIQTWGANTPESDRWLSCLGFEREGVLHSFLPDGGATSIWGIVCKPQDHSLVQD